MIRRRRPTPRRREAPRWSAEEWEAASLTLWERQRGRCWWCREELTWNAERHHRQRRRDGGDRFANVVMLHTPCHAAVHAHPEAARARGFIVPTWEYPTTVPVFDGIRWWRLDEEGTAIPAAHKEGEKPV